MKTYISIDGGTTNTRVCLVCGGQVKESKKIAIGSKDCINCNAPLKSEIKGAISALLTAHGLKESDVTAIIASGMITCEYGLCELPHIQAPAGLAELNAGMKKVYIEEISAIPFYFIPGVKVSGESFTDSDMMRGEETELMGLLNQDPDCVYVLPGSHNKLIEVDGNLRICKFETLLTGEMISALSQNTILKATVDLSVTEYEKEYLCEGYKAASERGLNAALFKTRILSNLFSGSKAQTYGYFLGTVLANEVDSLKKSGKNRVIIGGKSQLKKALTDLLEENSSMQITCIPDKDVDTSVISGQIRVFEYK